MIETPCTICGDSEPSHVHSQGDRIEDYFTVGRGETDFDAASRWHARAVRAEADLAHRLFEALLSGGMWPVYDASKPNRYRGGPFDMDARQYADALARKVAR